MAAALAVVETTDDQGGDDGPAQPHHRSLRALRAGQRHGLPAHGPLGDLIAALEAQGYKPCFEEIDARVARDAMSLCTNCAARGRFSYVGVKRDGVYRAFWSCEACRHWIEV